MSERKAFNAVEGKILDRIRKRLTPEQERDLDRMSWLAKEVLLEEVEDRGIEAVLKGWDSMVAQLEFFR